MSHADTGGKPRMGNIHGKQLYFRKPPPTGLHRSAGLSVAEMAGADPFTGNATGE